MYDPAFEKDSCGFGLIAQLDDRPSRAIVDAALDAIAAELENHLDIDALLALGMEQRNG